MGGQHHAPATLPPGKTRYPFYRRLGGPQDRSGRVRKISPPPGFDPRTVQPVSIRYPLLYNFSNIFQVISTLQASNCTILCILGLLNPAIFSINFNPKNNVFSLHKFMPFPQFSDIWSVLRITRLRENIENSGSQVADKGWSPSLKIRLIANTLLSENPDVINAAKVLWF
jgi:hypothetical protein